MNFFVTGTDTDVGKTYATALLVRGLRSAGLDAVGFKPISCGSWDDVDRLAAAADHCESREALGPCYFDLPASPLAAALSERRTIEPARILAAYRDLSGRHEIVLVEGAGGWLVPITPAYAVADLAKALELPVIVVVRNRLGALNHTLLTVESIRQRGLECAGLILNNCDLAPDLASESNRATLELLRTARVLCELSRGQTEIDRASLGLFGRHS